MEEENLSRGLFNCSPCGCNLNQAFLNTLLFANMRIPVSKTHYINSACIPITANFMCIENSLTNFTQSFNNICTNTFKKR